MYKEEKNYLSLEALVSAQVNSIPNPWANRFVVLCKDQRGKIGLKVQSYKKGIFVVHVWKGSPAAMAGLRFGDQILTLNRHCVAGWTEEEVHEQLRRAPVNNIVLAVRDRPLSRSLVLHKNKAGLLGIKISGGKVSGIARNSSAARNGLLLGQYILEVDGLCTVGISDHEFRKIIDKSDESVTITIMEAHIFEDLTRNMAEQLMKERMNRD
eukprot:TRINITY_DN24511_c0_g1_i1.p1 TRINITY_DN24511_c0_g1~~TRINITY_DN24511_c0_g1_i1.p1  ORF type:complete len:211 (+),score=30.90 TRINITY_DN24511_c0_g1_i1:55-687(+)